FGVELKGKDKSIDYLLKMQISNGVPKVVINSKDSLADLFYGFRSNKFERGVAPKKYTHRVVFGGNSATYDFNAIDESDPLYQSVTKFYTKILELMKANKVEEFLKLVEDRKAWEQQWEFEKSKGYTPNLSTTANAYQLFKPVAAIDLDPFVLVYFSDSKRTVV